MKGSEVLLKYGDKELQKRIFKIKRIVFNSNLSDPTSGVLYRYDNGALHSSSGSMTAIAVNPSHPKCHDEATAYDVPLWIKKT